jgi:hypothetical protein
LASQRDTTNLTEHSCAAGFDCDRTNFIEVGYAAQEFGTQRDGLHENESCRVMKVGSEYLSQEVSRKIGSATHRR